MNHTGSRMRKLTSVIAVGVVFAAFASVALAQSPMQQKVDVPFDFAAAGKDHPAGVYRVTVTKNAGGHAELVLMGKEGETRLPVMERLAAVGGTVTSTKFVFDKTNGKHTLSEVWLPSYDGFLVGTDGGDETHVVLPASKSN
jgi:hypothetical protein